MLIISIGYTTYLIQNPLSTIFKNSDFLGFFFFIVSAYIAILLEMPVSLLHQPNLLRSLAKTCFDALGLWKRRKRGVTLCLRICVFIAFYV